jgi:hypothetical protein
MELYIILLKALLKGENFRLYWKGIDLPFIENNFPELGRLYHSVADMQFRETKDYSLNDLKLRFFTLYPKAGSKAYEPLFQQLLEVTYDEATVADYLKSLSQRAVAFQIAQAALHVADGRKPPESLIAVVKEAPELLEGKTVIAGGADPYAHERPEQDIRKFREAQKNQPGIRWRMGSFNKALGSLRKGNFGFIFARPEVGKSAFILSEGTFMAQQGEGSGVWFDNEEEMTGIQDRILMAALGKPMAEIDADYDAAQREYDATVRGRFHLHSEGSMTKKFIEERCAFYKPKFIFINQLDKVKGFAADRYDLEMKAVYQWARELSKEYGPVIGVCQAGGSAENKKYLNMNDVDSSHTAKQGEADWILGIGMSSDSGSPYIRYFSLIKNKLPGDSDSDPQMRHGRWSGLIVPNISRYKDFDD